MLKFQIWRNSYRKAALPITPGQGQKHFSACSKLQMHNFSSLVAMTYASVSKLGCELYPRTVEWWGHTQMWSIEY
jgi:hypothetical protein